ncbi:inner membrane protein YpjD [bacterium]
MLKLISYLIASAYLVVCGAYIMVYVREDSRLRQPARIFAVAATLAHLVYLVFLARSLHHHPITTVFEAAATLAFMVSALFIILDIRLGARSVGIFIFLFVFALQLVSSVFLEITPSEYSMMSGIILPAHIYLALLGYSAFTIGFLYSIMYILLHREIRSGGFGRVFRRFPSLEELDELNYQAVLAGLVLLFVSIVLGFVWYKIKFEALPFFDAKVMFTLFAWMLYMIIALFRTMYGWHGRRIAILSICGFLIVMTSFTLVNLLARSFHAHF